MTQRIHTREDSGLVLDADGDWTHDGEPVEHPKIVEAFNRGLERAPDGRYLLRFGNDWCYVTVRDAPLQVRAARLDPAQRAVALALSNGAEERLDPAALTHRGGVLYCVSASGLLARFSRSAQAALSEVLNEGSGGFVLTLFGRDYPIEERPAEPAVAPGPPAP
jgi:hypothetical protein